MQYGMITYIVPLSVLADTYNGQPLMYVALASQKRYMSLYLTNVYGDESTEKVVQGSATVRPVRSWTWANRASASRKARRPAAGPGRRGRCQDAGRPSLSRSTKRPESGLRSRRAKAG